MGLNGGVSESGVAEFEQHMLRLRCLRFLVFGILICLKTEKGLEEVKENKADGKKLLIHEYHHMYIYYYYYYTEEVRV